MANSAPDYQVVADAHSAQDVVAENLRIKKAIWEQYDTSTLKKTPTPL